MDRSTKFVLAVALLMIASGVFIIASKTWVKKNGGWLMGEKSEPLPDNALRSKTGDLITGSDKFDGAKLGVPIYPGASQAQGGSLAFSGAQTELKNIAGATFTTPDSFDRVVAFYKGKFGPGNQIAEYDEGGERNVLMNATPQESKDSIGIRISRKRQSDTTEISIIKSSAQP